MALIDGNRPHKKRSTKLGIDHSANGQKPESLKTGAKADNTTQIEYNTNLVLPSSTVDIANRNTRPCAIGTKLDLSVISRHGLMVLGARKEFSTSHQIHFNFNGPSYSNWSKNIHCPFLSNNP